MFRHSPDSAFVIMLMIIIIIIIIIIKIIIIIITIIIIIIIIIKNVNDEKYDMTINELIGEAYQYNM